MHILGCFLSTLATLLSYAFMFHLCVIIAQAILFLTSPNVAKAEDAADGRRQGFGCNHLRRILDNAADAVSSAFPKGKQQGVVMRARDLTGGEFHGSY